MGSYFSLFFSYIYIPRKWYWLYHAVPYAKLMYNFIVWCDRILYLFNLAEMSEMLLGHTDVIWLGWAQPLKSTS